MLLISIWVNFFFKRTENSCNFLNKKWWLWDMLLQKFIFVLLTHILYLYLIHWNIRTFSKSSILRTDRCVDFLAAFPRQIKSALVRERPACLNVKFFMRVSGNAENKKWNTDLCSPHTHKGNNILVSVLPEINH